MNDLPFPTVGIAGIGLIGGSLAKDLRAFGLAGRILGWNRTAAHAERAVELGLVDAALPTLGELAAQSDLLVLAMPVDVLAERLPALLDAARPDQTLIDVGSTKRALAEAVAGHPNRARYVACHPMAGTERSGPDAAVDNLFRNRFTLIIDPWLSAPDALSRVRALWERVGAVLAEMSAEIKEAERNQALNARFAGGGLASMTRIAHSPISMWQPIFRQNKGPLLEAVDAFADLLAAFRRAIAEDDGDALAELMR